MKVPRRRRVLPSNRNGFTMAKNDTPKSAPKAAKAPKASHDLLKEMLADVNKSLKAIADVIATVQTHGDMTDEHITLAKSAKKLAKEAHSQIKSGAGDK